MCVVDVIIQLQKCGDFQKVAEYWLHWIGGTIVKTLAIAHKRLISADIGFGAKLNPRRQGRIPVTYSKGR